jgi:hypothetical protein
MGYCTPKWGTVGNPGFSQGFFRKKMFRQKCTKDMFLGSVFDGDHESAIIYMKIHMKRYHSDHKILINTYTDELCWKKLNQAAVVFLGYSHARRCSFSRAIFQLLKISGDPPFLDPKRPNT